MSNQFVNNLLDLKRHVSLHRRRVFALGWRLRPLVNNPTVLFLVLLVHDLEKYLFLPWLWKYYGVKGKNHKTDARKLYTRMNKVGYHIRNITMLPFFWNKENITQAIIIEHIADVVDRNTDPVAMEEFCLTIQKPMSLFLLSESLKIAETLKPQWFDITNKLQYDRE